MKTSFKHCWKEIKITKYTERGFLILGLYMRKHLSWCKSNHFEVATLSEWADWLTLRAQRNGAP